MKNYKCFHCENTDPKKFRKVGEVYTCQKCFWYNSKNMFIEDSE